MSVVNGDQEHDDEEPICPTFPGRGLGECDPRSPFCTVKQSPMMPETPPRIKRMIDQDLHIRHAQGQVTRPEAGSCFSDLRDAPDMQP